MSGGETVTPASNAEVPAQPDTSQPEPFVPTMFNTLNIDRATNDPGVTPDQLRLLQHALTRIDQQALEHWGQYRPDISERVAFPYTYVDVSALDEELGLKSPNKSDVSKEGTQDGLDQTTAEVVELAEEPAGTSASEDEDAGTTLPKDIDTAFVVIPGFAPPATINHAMASWENVQDRIFKRMREAAGKDGVRVYIVGYPFGLGGELSEEWIQRVQKEGYSAYGEALASLFEQFADGSDRLIVTGHSMGAPVAEAVSGNVNRETRKKIRLLLDAPADTKGLAAGLRMGASFLHSGVAALIGKGGPMTRQETELSTERTAQFSAHLENVLRSKGIAIPKNGPERDSYNKMSSQAAANDLLRILSGKAGRLVPDDVRTFVRANWMGESLADPRRLLKHIARRKDGSLGAHMYDGAGRTLHVPTDETHFIDRFNHRKWIGLMESLRTEAERARNSTADESTSSPETTEPAQGDV